MNKMRAKDKIRKIGQDKLTTEGKESESDKKQREGLSVTKKCVFGLDQSTIPKKST